MHDIAILEHSYTFSTNKGNRSTGISCLTFILNIYLWILIYLFVNLIFSVNLFFLINLFGIMQQF